MNQNANERLIQESIVSRGLNDPRLIAAFRRIPREEFVTGPNRAFAYADMALPIGAGQTISQPSLVALMIALLELSSEDNALEIGAGSGYAAAILAQICKEVVAVERIKELADEARLRLARLEINNVEIVHDDGTEGWSKRAPYSGILVSAGANDVPRPLLEQLKTGARMVIPVGGDKSYQKLVRVKKTKADAFTKEEFGDVRFVPLIGTHGW